MDDNLNMSTNGVHLIMDIWLNENVEWKKLKNLIASCLMEYKQLILSFEEWSFYPKGESGVFLLATSHCSIHTYPQHKYISIDVYSCDQNFNAEEFSKYFTEKLPIKHINQRCLNRGDLNEKF